MRHASVAFLFASLLTASCRPHAGQYEVIQTAALPTSLVVLAGASSVKAYRQSDTCVFVQYDVSVRYPAESVVASLSRELSQLGLLPQASLSVESALLPQPEVEWHRFFDAVRKPTGRVDQLLLSWRDSSGNVTSYELRYTSPSKDPADVASSPANDTLHVAGIFMPAPVAKAWAEFAKASPTPSQ